MISRFITSSILVAAALALGSCGKTYEEFYFTGHCVGAEICSSHTMGYLIEVDYPKDLGDTITAYGKKYKNAIMGYRSPKMLKDGEVIYGVGYLQEGFAALNCMGIYYYSIPEVVLLSVDEDSATVMSHLITETND